MYCTVTGTCRRSNQADRKECFSRYLVRLEGYPLVYHCLHLRYPVAFATCVTFMPVVLKRLGYSTLVTNPLTVTPSSFGFLVLLGVTYKSDRTRERTFHIIGSLMLSVIGLIILAAIGAEASRGAAYFAKVPS